MRLRFDWNMLDSYRFLLLQLLLMLLLLLRLDIRHGWLDRQSYATQATNTACDYGNWFRKIYDWLIFRYLRVWPLRLIWYRLLSYLFLQLVLVELGNIGSFFIFKLISIIDLHDIVLDIFFIYV